ncbi:Protein kinase-like (PK-like) [Apiospora arundinis]
METNYPLPYFADPRTLPVPLPTPKEIEASQDILKASASHRIVRAGTHYAVKYGVGVQLIEGENMLFVRRQCPSIMIPTVYAMFSHDREGNGHPPTNYIVMEYVPGKNLESCWSSLDERAKGDVAAKLRTYFNQMRKIPSPGYFGALGKRPFCDDFVWLKEECEDDKSQHYLTSGPFDSEAALLDALVAKYEFHTQGVLQDGYRKHEYYRYMLPRVLKSGTSVFTHGDLQLKNVILREGDGEVVIIDWESAAWHPRYWEFYATMFCCQWKDDWHLWVGQILDEYPNEFAWMNMIFR